MLVVVDREVALVLITCVRLGRAVRARMVLTKAYDAQLGSHIGALYDTLFAFLK